MMPPSKHEKRRLKYAVTINDEALGENTDPDFELKYIDIGNVDSDGKIDQSATYRFENSPSRARRIVKHGDVIISTVRTYLQAIAPIENPDENLIVSTGFAVVRPRPAVLDSSYCKYALRETTFLNEVVARSVGVSYPAINASDLGDIPIELHPLTVQRSISAYLDRETSHIDALIAAKERLIELLAEKRRALITQAVTKGLNPDAPMRDSGLPWLGEIPRHWEVKKVWLLFELGRGRVISNVEIADNQGEYPVYSSQTENEGVMGYLNSYDFDGSYLTWTTDGANAGTVFHREGRFNCTNVCGTLKAKNAETNLSFFQHVLNLATSWFVRQDINPKLMNNVMARIPIQVPPIEEQRAIAEYISEEALRIDRLTTGTIRTIDLLRERRSALIAAAVTGKIMCQQTQALSRVEA